LPEGRAGTRPWPWPRKWTLRLWAAPSSERAPFLEDHPLYLGDLPFAIGPLARHLDGHDLAVVVGAPVFRYYPYAPGDYLPDGLQLWHVTDDLAEAGRAPIGDSILGDPVLTIEQLLPAGPQTARDVFDELRASARPMPCSWRRRPRTSEICTRPGRSPSRTRSTPWPAAGWGGWSAQASVGIALAERDSRRNPPVVMVIGDGSFQYSLQSLWTAAQLRLPILFVVLCNCEYAILKAFAEAEDSPGVPGLDIPDIDIVALARGYGCYAAKAETVEMLRSEVAAAVEGHAPTVLEVPIAATVPSLL